MIILGSGARVWFAPPLFLQHISVVICVSLSLFSHNLPFHKRHFSRIVCRQFSKLTLHKIPYSEHITDTVWVCLCCLDYSSLLLNLILRCFSVSGEVPRVWSEWYLPGCRRVWHPRLHLQAVVWGPQLHRWEGKKFWCLFKCSSSVHVTQFSLRK